MASTEISFEELEGPVASTSVRITRREYMRLISELDRAAGPAMNASSPSNRRTQNRIPFLRDARMLCELNAHNEKISQYLVRCRNISKRGLSFLHETSIEPGVSCELTLLGAEHDAYEITGKIVRSRAIAQSVYEVAVRFAYTVDLSLFVVPRTSHGILPLPASRIELLRRAAV